MARLEQRHSLTLLRMVAGVQPKRVVEFRDSILQDSLEFANRETPDFILIKEAVLIFQHLNDSFDTISNGEKEYIFTLVSKVVQHIGTADTEWICAMESLVNVFFGLKSKKAHEHGKLLITFCHQQIGKCQYPNENHYSQMFFVVGHVAIKMLTFVDMLENDIKKAISSKKGPAEHDDDLAQISGGNDAEIEQYTQALTKITEEQLIQEGLIGLYLPQIQKVSSIALQRYQVKSPAQLEQLNQARPQVDLLARSAIMALCKIMCVSTKLCQENLMLIFDLLDSEVDFGVKNNIIVALGDMFNRFPNVLNEYSRRLFQLLHDKDNHVRR